MNEDHCYAALRARDRSEDGRFWYGVVTTGIYCRPSCASRLPLRKNIRFFVDAAAARRAGMRACKRCAPDARNDPAYARIARVRAIIDVAEEIPTLAALSAAVDVSESYLQRQFTKIVGVSPWRYADTRRRERFRHALRVSAGVSAAIYDAGYGAASRAYADASTLGMTPAAYAAGGTGTISYAIVPSALGEVLVATTPRGVCAVRLGDDARALEAELRAEFPAAALERADDALASVTSRIVAYIAGSGAWPELPLDVRGSVFQRRVWDVLRSIACGDTRTYGDLAAALGDVKAARAVGSACAANPVALLVPCHRVLPKAGGPGAYRWGAARKRALLALEATSGS